jgi:hypothetical protein
MFVEEIDLYGATVWDEVMSGIPAGIPETVPVDLDPGFPRPLETPITDKCEDTLKVEDSKPDRTFREDVASVMNVQGRYKDASRYLECGKVTRDVCRCGHKATKTRVMRCGLRECQVCAGIEAKRLYLQILVEMGRVDKKPGWTWRHAVLTSIRKPGTDLKEDLKKVKAGLKRLRYYLRGTTKATARYRAGISAVGGIEFGPKNGMVHVHLMIYAPFIPKDEMEKAWSVGTIHFKEITSARQIENVCLYAIDFTKKKKDKRTGELIPLSPVFIANVGKVLKGWRRIFTWGGLYKRIKKKEKTKKNEVCPKCGEKMSWEVVRGVNNAWIFEYS